MADLVKIREMTVEARESHVQWRDHYAAHEASGVPCDRCREFPQDRNPAYEQRWIDYYDDLLALLARWTPRSVKPPTL